MKQYKYFLKAYDENKQLFFFHRSNYAYKLLDLAEKSSYDDSGAMFSRWYFGKIEHNIPLDILYRICCGEKI